MPDGPSIDFTHHYAPDLRIAGQAQALARADVLDPATGRPFGDAPVAEEETLDRAVAAAMEAQREWRTRPWQARADTIRAFADAVAADADILGHLLAREQGKPLAKARGEVMGAGFFMNGFADLTLEPETFRDVDAQYVQAERRPIGVVAGITAWNYPVLLAAWKIAPAVLTGNAVILKPAPSTPLASLRLAELADRVFPPGLVAVLTGDDRLGPWITAHPRIGKVSFTGSVATGQAIMQNAAPTLKRLTLELGGNDAAIVMPDFDVAKHAAELFWSAMSNCGQVCAAAKRIFVPDGLYAALCTQFGQIASGAIVGPWNAEGVEIGPMQNAAQAAKVRDLITRAKAAGAVVVYEGTVPDGDGFWVPPTVLRDAADDNPVVAEEQFGPVIALSHYTDIDEVIARANADPHGLGASVWGEDLDLAMSVASQLEAGTAWVNQHPSMGPEIPFGGIKASGYGVECGRRGLEEYTVPFVLNVKRN
ncbi:MAG: aldehyde dehydrogenase family protein [Pseudomonadota bacterium]